MTVFRGNTTKVSKQLRLMKMRRLWFPVEKQIGDEFALT